MGNAVVMGAKAHSVQANKGKKGQTLRGENDDDDPINVLKMLAVRNLIHLTNVDPPVLEIDSVDNGTKWLYWKSR